MKYLLFLLLLFIPALIHALPCPNGQGILYKGDSIEEVIRQCGEPASRNTYTRTIYSQQQVIYYRTHQYDQGFSQLVIFFKNNRVARIQVNDRYWLPVCLRSFVQVGRVMTVQTSCGDWIYETAYTNLCGGRVFGINDSKEFVESICGRPAAETNLETYTDVVTELTYNGKNPQAIIFQNGRLIEWR